MRYVTYTLLKLSLFLCLMLVYISYNLASCCSAKSDLTRSHTGASGKRKKKGTQRRILIQSRNAVSLEKRIEGAILAGALGDALGRETEFIGTLQELGAYFTSAGNISLKRYQDQPIIWYTDDTLMSRLVFDVFLEGRCKAWSDEQMMKQLATDFINWVHPIDGPARDPHYALRAHGNANRSALRIVKRQKEQEGGRSKWYEPAVDEEEKRKMGGCGSVMRAWPAGIVWSDDPSRAIALATAQSAITHQLPMAEGACAALAAAVAKLIEGAPWEEAVAFMITTADTFLPAIKNYQTCTSIPGDMQDETVREKIRKTMIPQNLLALPDMLRYAYQAGLKGDGPEKVLGTRDDRTTQHRSHTGALLGWSADEALAAALYVATCALKEPKEHAWRAIQMGAFTPGDSDSIALIAGVLIGAYKGLVLPPEEAQLLSKIEHYKELVALSRRVIRMVPLSKAQRCTAS